MSPARFPFVSRSQPGFPPVRAPFLPLSLQLGSTRIDVAGLLDSGAAVNVLPHSVGLRLGAVWNPRGSSLPLAGGLAAVPSQPLQVTGIVGPFPPVTLLFAWAATDAMPVILGQTNFLQTFDVCFYGSRSEFDILPTTP